MDANCAQLVYSCGAAAPCGGDSAVCCCCCWLAMVREGNTVLHLVLVVSIFVLLFQGLLVVVRLIVG